MIAIDSRETIQLAARPARRMPEPPERSNRPDMSLALELATLLLRRCENQQDASADAAVKDSRCTPYRRTALNRRNRSWLPGDAPCTATEGTGHVSP